MTASEQAPVVQAPEIRTIRPRRPISHRLVWLGVLGGIIFCLWPAEWIQQPRTGLDSSWVIGLNLAVLRGDHFGVDHVFTYGPLGFLWTRLGLGMPLSVFFLHELSMMLLAWGALYAVWRDRRSVWDVALAFAVLLISRGSNSMPVGLFMIHSFLGLAGSVPALIMASVLALLLFFVKLNYGLIVLGISLGLWVWAAWRRQISWKMAVTAGSLLIAMLAGFAWMLNVPLFEYVVTGLSVCSGYNDAMMRPVGFEHRDLVLALIYLVALSVMGMGSLLATKDRWLVGVGVVLAGLYFLLSFKNGFLRADSGHMVQFFELTPFVFLGVLLLALGWGRGLARGVLAGVLLLGALSHPESMRFLLPSARAVALNRYIHDGWSEADRKQRFSEEDRLKRVFPPSVAAAMGTNAYDIVGKEISYALANDAPYRPRPMPYSYLVYNAALDDLNAAYLAGPQAPEYIVFFAQTIDNRFVQWDEPRTKQVLLERYAVVRAGYDEDFYRTAYPDVARAVADGVLSNAYEHYHFLGRQEGRSPNLCLLKQRSSMAKLQCLGEQPWAVRLGETVSVPAAEDLLYWQAEVHYTWLGRLRSLLFQPPVLEVQLWDAAGRTRTYRIVRELLPQGVLLNRYLGQPGEIDGLEALHRGDWKSLPRIERICIRSSASWAVKPVIEGKLCAMTFRPESEKDSAAKESSNDTP